MTRFVFLLFLLLTGCAVHRRPALPAVATSESKPPEVGSLDPEWEPFRSYMNALVQKVQTRWEHVVLQWTSLPKVGTKVRISFDLDAEGKIALIRDVTGDVAEIGKKAAVSAIVDGGPYGVWSDAMKAALGTKTELTFTFYYE